MKKISPFFPLILSIFLVLFFFAPQTCLSAKEKPGTFSFSLHGGDYSFENSENLQTDSLLGLRLGYEFPGQRRNRALRLEALANLVQTDAKGGGSDADVYIFRIEALYPLLPQKKVKPFLALGAGGIVLDRESQTDEHPIVSYGLGVEYYFEKYLALRGDVRHVLVVDDQKRDNFEYTIGLTYVFGQERRKKPVPPADSDGDGVPDRKDRCADTPTGWKVDGYGCPIDPPDIDEDGVPDYMDRCPLTPDGYAVDEAGCMKDSDGDGVPDHLDKCSRNPLGLKVDEEGCIDRDQ